MRTPYPYTARRFARPYLKMVVAMLAGMLVLGGSAGLALGALGVDLLVDARSSSSSQWASR
jgi:hypothetical protein